MSKLEPPDLHRWNAAQGWIELGSPGEARRELDAISPDAQSHLDVLEVRWSLDAAEGNWEAALATAEELLVRAPDRCSAWIHRSYSLHELKRTSEAWDRLLPAVALFPEVTTVPYNLACYACQLGRVKDAREWLDRAMTVGERKQVMAMALGDPDLQPLWLELKRAS